MANKPFSIKLLICSIFAFSFINTSTAQHDYIKQGYQSQSYLPYSLHRLQFGVSTVGAVVNCEGDLIAQKEDGTPFERYHNRPIASRGGFGFTAGTFYRLLKIGKTASVATDVNLMYNFIYWRGIGKGDYFKNEWDNAAATRQLAVPLGLDIKFGLDGRLEKNHRLCMSFGGGIMPAYNVTTLQVDDDSLKKPNFKKFSATPYVKAEVGVFMGICFKIRAIWSIGDYKLANDASVWHKEDKYGYSNFNMTGKSTFAVSLLAMPFSYDWPDNGWWNNSRTSGAFYPWK